jgi:hypothetical protein
MIDYWSFRVQLLIFHAYSGREQALFLQTIQNIGVREEWANQPSNF